MSRRLAVLLSSVAVAAVAVSTPALAQEVEAATELGEIVVTGSQVRLPPAYAGGQVATGGRAGLLGSLDLMDTPFATTSYTEALIRDQQARSVADVLQNDPAVRVTKGFGNFQELYVIRGFPVYSDDMTYNGLFGVLPRQFVAAELLERVEVFHGATAFLNGAAPGGSGVGGAFNLVPKRAGDVPLNRLSAGWSGEDELYAAADLSRRFGADREWGLRLNLAGRDGSGAVDGEDRQLRVIGLGVDHRGDRTRFSADLGWQDHRIDAPRPSVTPTGSVPAPPDADANFAQPWTYTDEQQLFGAARGEVDLTDDVVAWAAFGGRQGEEANRLANPRAQANGTLSAYRFDNERRDTVWSGDVGVRADLTTGAVGHRLVASASRVQSKSENAYAFSNFAGFASDLYDPVAVAPPAADFFVGGDMDAPNVTERVENASLALADMMSFLDGRLLVTAGVRHQSIETRSYDYNTGAGSSSYEGDAITPAFAVVYKPSERVSLYANYAEALVPGQTAPAVSGGVPVDNAGEVLDPFRGEQAEVGAKYDGGAFGTSISLFRLTLPSAFVENNVFAANGEQENRGLELSLFGEPVEGLRLLGGVTLLDAELTRTAGGTGDGNAPIGAPELQGNLNVEWDIPAVPGLTLEGRAVHTGPQFVNAANTVELESWTRFDAGVRYAFEAGGRSVTVRARVENLADEDQWVAVGGYPGANYLTLGAPRSVSVSISADF
ncbi:TonB-dependent receptor [Brevundimonas viscosa]|uniref:Iron complex outermembrane recepter protein n=1 Tax=Brevundimonas viscosa TaxID=871741 RepID=A0A1I6S461_9CAUL|nr:TonB-dependent siderophore receptor [Brevundimonas viscosa]SFS71727.1 iron complex outermembrane recepter protein [Brevundimonas viscosa]